MYKIITRSHYLSLYPAISLLLPEGTHIICGFIPFYTCVWSMYVWSIYLVLFCMAAFYEFFLICDTTLTFY